ncbi:putative glycosyltransferase [Gordonia namibiensis NBRC 108229]|uniref:Putative glycosyltransferase n=1 Tax=Gordonia namibiensis NBRC 108229 TaxID=1208314 RepID=K6XJ72_9ACTN|nr:putative glycosyltransferase [Gordonia namibiensis NBRC 108229]
MADRQAVNVEGGPYLRRRTRPTAQAEPARGKTQGWVHGYLVRVAWTDALIVAASVTIAQIVRFGADNAMASAGALDAPVTIVSVVLGLTWVGALRAFQTLDRRIIGAGTAEYSRVATACFAVFGMLAILDLLFRLNIARGFLAVALPLGTLGLLTARWGWRRRLSWQRAHAQNQDQLLIVGDPEAAHPLAKRLVKRPTLGYEVVGVCLPPGRHSKSGSLAVGEHSLPVYSHFENISDAVRACSADAVAITTPSPGHEFIRELSWELEGLGVDVLVAPGVTDVAGPRMMMRQVEGLPLLHIDKPRYGASQTVLKTSLDYVVALVAILLAAPVMFATAIAIKAHDGGPVFYRQLRVGKDGQSFRVWKFRSMRPEADKFQAGVSAAAPGVAQRSVFFKAEDDPRITPIGRFIRRTSIDELPQLFNVLTRDMSVVGPRPLVPGEGSEIPNFVERRLLVKPGITGLWQVSGRSDLAEEDRIRLDLVYVENWSIMQDLTILWRTVKAVLKKDGAY